MGIDVLPKRADGNFYVAVVARLRSNP